MVQKQLVSIKIVQHSVHITIKYVLAFQDSLEKGTLKVATESLGRGWGAFRHP